MVYALLVDQLLASVASNGNPGNNNNNNNNGGVFLKNVPLIASVTIMAITTAIMAAIMGG
jgi:hypothetical protein